MTRSRRPELRLRRPLHIIYDPMGRVGTTAARQPEGMMMPASSKRNTGARVVLLVILALPLVSCHAHKRLSDSLFEPRVDHPAFAAGAGPRVVIDEGHCNYHTADGLFRPFADLLRRDGFVVEPLKSRFTAEALASVDVLVIANALAEQNCDDEWSLPNPSAFRSDEIAAVARWVEGGGALLLIADHMPFAGAAEELAGVFGVAFINGYAKPDAGGSAIRFERSAGTLAAHAITAGRSADEQVDAVVTFTGQGFRSLRGGVFPLLTLPADVTMRLPREAGIFTEETPSFSAEGLLQGAVLSHGEGRVAVFGEAAMFSAQISNVDEKLVKVGMNAPGAEQNTQLILNLMHWLNGMLE